MLELAVQKGFHERLVHHHLIYYTIGFFDDCGLRSRANGTACQLVRLLAAGSKGSGYTPSWFSIKEFILESASGRVEMTLEGLKAVLEQKAGRELDPDNQDVPTYYAAFTDYRLCM